MRSVPDVLAAARRTALDIEALLLPQMCLACEDTLPARWNEGPLCARCRLLLRPVGPPRCTRCAQTLDAWERASGQADKRASCGLCQHWPASLHWASSAVWLDDGPARDLVHALKYDGWRSAGGPMAQAIVRHCGHLLPPGAVLVPIPLGRTRLRERGHNQADVLAREIGRLSGHSVEARLLSRSRETRTQTDLGPTQRHENVRGAFSVLGHPSSVIVLVDDVLTTGATLCAAAEALARAGCPAVGAITFARAPIPA